MGSKKKILISIFLLLNFCAMFRIHLPMDKKFFMTVFKPIDSYLSVFSIYQDWMMFAPVPNRFNLYISAEVEFIDGSREQYVFPRTSEMSLLEKYHHGERFRKITAEGIRRDDFKFMWPDTAKFVLRKIRERTMDKLPLRVHLSRHWETIPDMDKEFRLHKETAKNYQSNRFYTYEVL